MKVPIARTHLTKKEFNIIRKPLESGWVVQGPYVEEFENKWNEYTGSKHSIAVTSCTTALHLSLAALGLKPNDEVIVPAFTWISTANVVEHLNAKVIFCDIDLKTFNIDENQIEEKITPKTKAIIPVHLFGLSADMGPILDIAQKHNLWVVEDAACGFGARYNGKHVGTFGDTGCFSFHPRKAITTGEGGMITTNDDKLAEKMRSIRDHGAAMSDFQRHHGAKPYLLAEHPYAGYNYRMTDIQASLGVTQMERADDIVIERQTLASNYYKAFQGTDFFQLPYNDINYNHGYQSYPCIFDIDKANIDNIKVINQNRNAFMDNLQNDGVSTRPATHAVHMLQYYKEKYELEPEDFPNAFIANNCSISFPLFNGITQHEQDYVIKTVAKYL
ncbi:MAG: aminotransferase DegT [Rickettsiales bacterium]|nr:aminotransferase DegT [Rickettsiales bacterium]